MGGRRIDWVAIAPGVVQALLGDPNRRLTRGRKLRYRRKGSLWIDLDKAGWYDFEAKERGGLSKLIQRERGCDWLEARKWLEQQGFIEPWRPERRRGGAGGRAAGTGRRVHGRGGGSALRGAEAASGRDAGEARDETGRVALAEALWQAGGPIPDSPAMAYLARRGTWPLPDGFGAGWPALPKAFRWLSREAMRDVDAGTRYRVLSEFPADAAGCLMAGHLDMPDGRAVRAVSMDALRADGARPDGERWRKVRGVLHGAAVWVPGRPQGDQIAIVEGEADALAVGMMARAGLDGYGDVGEVRAVGGVSGFQPDRAADEQGRPVVLLPDGPGRDGTARAEGAAVQCATWLRAAGRTVRVRFRADGDEAGDPAGDLAAALMERAARFELDGPDVDAEQARAERMAWRAILGLSETEGGSNG